MRNLMSHYGWMIVSTLILVVLLALASPLGMFFADNFIAITQSAGEHQEHIVGDGYKTQVEEYEEMFVSNEYQDPGIYKETVEKNIVFTKWDDLLDSKLRINEHQTVPVIQLAEDENGVRTLVTNYDKTTMKNLSSPVLFGELVVKPGIPIIGEYCFADLSLLTSIRITGAQLIEEGAFYNCKNLKSITLSGDQLKLIEKDAFKGCEKLTTIYFFGTYEEFSKIQFESQGISKQIKVVCNDTTVNIKF